MSCDGDSELGLSVAILGVLIQIVLLVVMSLTLLKK
jgi:hypothetical protein